MEFIEGAWLNMQARANVAQLPSDRGTARELVLDPSDTIADTEGEEQA